MEFVFDVILVSNPVILDVFASTEAVKLVILDVAVLRLLVNVVMLLVFELTRLSILVILFVLAVILVSNPVTL